MNPLTLVKRIQNINAKEASLGISDEASWHAKYRDSAYVFAGGIPFDLTEGDLLAIFAQYGEIVDVNLVRNKDTGKSKGFAFIAYEDQRSTILAVDNLNGAQVLGRTIRVDHVDKYKKKEEEDEETQQKKREERGVCYAFQKGECNRGAGCKYSHDEQRAANTGGGHKEDRHSKWGHDKFDGSRRNGGQFGRSGHGPESPPSQVGSNKSYEKQLERKDRDKRERDESKYREELNWRDEKRSRRHESDSYHRDGRDKRERDESHGRGSKWHDESKNREDRDRRDEKRSRRYESESYNKDDRDSRSKDDEYHRHRSHR